MIVTTFSRRTVSIGERRSTSWTAFTRALARPRVTEHKSFLPLYSCVEFVGNHAAKSDVVRAYALGFDVDVEPFTTLDELAAVIDGYAATIHTTYSGAPHLRLHMLPARPLTGTEYALMHRAVATTLRDRQIGVGREAVDPSRRWFVPAHAPGATYDFRVLDGQPLDVDSILAVEHERLADEERQREQRRRLYEARAKQRGVDPERALLERAVEQVSRASERHSSLNRWTFTVASKTQIPDHEIESAMAHAAHVAGLHEREIERTIRGALRSARRGAA